MRISSWAVTLGTLSIAFSILLYSFANSDSTAHEAGFWFLIIGIILVALGLIGSWKYK